MAPFLFPFNVQIKFIILGCIKDALLLLNPPISYMFSFLMVVIQSVSARVSWFTLSLSFHSGHFILTRFG